MHEAVYQYCTIFNDCSVILNLSMLFAQNVKKKSRLLSHLTAFALITSAEIHT
jgi:hypothetical protein